MMLTETEAKTKWCHRFTSRDENEDQRCIASACMAWRWEMEDGQYDTKQRTGRGYCGLAGTR